MAEPITLTMGALIWEYGLKPIADSIKKEYGDESKKLLKSGMEKVFNKLSLKKEEQEIIEAEIIEADVDVLSDEKRFLEFIQNNSKIPNDLKQNTYTFNKEVYGNVIDKVESGATVSTSYHFGDVHNNPK
jgi:predicted nucleotide-binding protein (sugar kinase/HSP70/actin superfamily)